MTPEGIVYLACLSLTSLFWRVGYLNSIFSGLVFLPLASLLPKPTSLQDGNSTQLEILVDVVINLWRSCWVGRIASGEKYHHTLASSG